MTDRTVLLTSQLCRFCPDRMPLYVRVGVPLNGMSENGFDITDMVEHLSEHMPPGRAEEYAATIIALFLGRMRDVGALALLEEMMRELETMPKDELRKLNADARRYGGLAEAANRHRTD